MLRPDSVEVMARVVYEAWKEGMMMQGRSVDGDRMEWYLLDEREKELDRHIARRILDTLLQAID